MINNLILKNFKCFTEECIQFNNMTVLTGANSSGKSSIIQALLIILNSQKIDNEKIIDLAEVFEQPIGGSTNFKSNNSIGNDSFSFQISAISNEKRTDFQYLVDKMAMENLILHNNPDNLGYDYCYLNAERIGPRLVYDAGGKKRLKSNGSNAVYLIDWMNNDDEFQISEILTTKRATKFSDTVEAWMSAILGNMQISVNTDLIKSQSEFKVKMGCSFEPVIPTMSGFGISYVLPIVTAGLICSSKKKSILIIENPEAHLHPAAQSNMGKFIEIVAESGVQVIVETHSEHIIDGIRVQAAYDKFHENVTVNFMTMHDESSVSQAIKVNNFGELEEWPKGFFDQKQSDLKELFELRRKK